MAELPELAALRAATDSGSSSSSNNTQSNSNTSNNNLNSNSNNSSSSNSNNSSSSNSNNSSANSNNSSSSNSNNYSSNSNNYSSNSNNSSANSNNSSANSNNSSANSNNSSANSNNSSANSNNSSGNSNGSETPTPPPPPPPLTVRRVVTKPLEPPKKEPGLQEFYDKRSKKPNLYGYDGRGNLVVRNKDGSIETTIALPKYRPLSVEERASIDAERLTAIATAEEQYEQAMDELRAKIGEFVEGRALPGEVKDAQLDVERADEARLHAQYAAQATTVLSGVKYNELFPAQKYNVRTIDHAIYKRTIAEFAPKDFYVRAMTADEEANEDAAAEDVAEQELQVGTLEGSMTVDRGVKTPAAPAPPPSNTLILFNRPNDNEYGYLANDYAVRFSWEKQAYFTADQAIAAEKARYYGNMEALKQIMATKSPVTMRKQAKDLDAAPTAAAAPETEAEAAVRGQKAADWLKVRDQKLVSILYAKFDQNPALRRQLLETGDADLAYADHRNMEDGIGLAIADARAGTRAKWRGQNKLGEALKEVRRMLRGGAEGGAAAAGAGGAEAPELSAGQKARIAIVRRTGP